MKKHSYDPAKGSLLEQVERIMGVRPKTKAKSPARTKRTIPYKKYYEPQLSCEEEILVDHMAHMERLREAIDDVFFELLQHLKENPELETAWQQFITGGGVDADDLRHVLKHGSNGRKQVRTRKLLRLVVVNQKPKVARMKSKREDPEDAA